VEKCVQSGRSATHPVHRLLSHAEFNEDFLDSGFPENNCCSSIRGKSTSPQPCFPNPKQMAWRMLIADSKTRIIYETNRTTAKTTTSPDRFSLTYQRRCNSSGPSFAPPKKVTRLLETRTCAASSLPPKFTPNFRVMAPAPAISI
jgi:hypothetical protein